MTTRDLVLISLFAAIIAALGLLPPIPLGFIPVPITAQTLGVMLAGVVLGARRGALAVALVYLLLLAGLPILSGGRGGYGAFAAPTAGFLIGWLPGAIVTGLIAERIAGGADIALRQIAGLFAAAVIGGIVIVYLFGIPGLSLITGAPLDKAFFGSIAFIPGDLIKAGIAALAGKAVLAGYPLLPQRQ